MRPDILTMIAILIVPAAAQQRGLISAVEVPRPPAQAGVPVDISMRGTNPCGAVRIDPGDGSGAVTHPLAQLPATVRHVYQKAGRFELRAEGMGNCDGVVATSVQVNPAPAPPPVPAPPAPPPASPPSGRILDMDADRDGVVTRAEWRGPEQSFRVQDANGDGVLSGAEVRDEGTLVRATERWTGTGVYVREGDVVGIESSGTVQLSGDAADTSSPGGAGSGRRALSAPMPDRPAGSLIARIGNGPAFFVGAEPTFRANASGQLFFGINDDHLADNGGEFRVKIDPNAQRRRRR